MNLNKNISGWGKYLKVKSNIITPKNFDDCRNYLNTPLIPRGMGRSYGDSANYKTVLQTNFLNHSINFNKEKGLLTCEAGITINDILKLIVPYGWFIPVSPGTSYATLGGAIASDVHGKNHHHSGTFSQYVLSLKIMIGNGEILDISPNNTKDLFHATCGGMGLTGIILSATIKLLKIESSKIKQIELKTKSLEETCSIFEENKNSTYSVAWLDCMATGRSQGKSIVILGEHDDEKNLNFEIKKNINIPFNIPSFILNKYSIAAFNKFYYMNSSNKRIKKVKLSEYFYPLDKINNWNRLYG